MLFIYLPWVACLHYLAAALIVIPNGRREEWGQWATKTPVLFGIHSHSRSTTCLLARSQSKPDPVESILSVEEIKELLHDSISLYRNNVLKLKNTASGIRNEILQHHQNELKGSVENLKFSLALIERDKVVGAIDEIDSDCVMTTSESTVQSSVSLTSSSLERLLGELTALNERLKTQLKSQPHAETIKVDLVRTTEITGTESAAITATTRSNTPTTHQLMDHLESFMKLIDSIGTCRIPSPVVFLRREEVETWNGELAAESDKSKNIESAFAKIGPDADDMNSNTAIPARVFFASEDEEPPQSTPSRVALGKNVTMDAAHSFVCVSTATAIAMNDYSIDSNHKTASTLDWDAGNLTSTAVSVAVSSDATMSELPLTIAGVALGPAVRSPRVFAKDRGIQSYNSSKPQPRIGESIITVISSDDCNALSQVQTKWKITVPFTAIPEQRYTGEWSQQEKHTALDHNPITPYRARQIDSLVKQRSEARWSAEYQRADELKEKIHILSPLGFEIKLKDYPRKEGGGTSWTVEPIQRSEEDKTAYHKLYFSGETILQLAHMALGAAVQSSMEACLSRSHSVGSSCPTTETGQIMGYSSRVHRIDPLHPIEGLIQQARERLDRLQAFPDLVSVELGGRKSADACFWFALAGCRDQDFFDQLAALASIELERSCFRQSCRSKDVYQILERFAASGLREHDRLTKVARNCLKLKKESLGRDDYPQNILDFHSLRSLLCVWKFSTKQKKQYAFLKAAQKHWERQGMLSTISSAKVSQKSGSSGYDWGSMFDAPKRPLVVDIGCGFGVSLLGLASSTTEDQSRLQSRLLSKRYRWCDCNFVGVDLGEIGLRFASGISHRWGLAGRLQFVIDSAEGFCRSLSSYPGEVILVLCQFPTPYRLATGFKSGIGNLQLPASQTDGFMVTENLLQLIHGTLSLSGGNLVLLSNVEDCAVYMRNLACHKCGFAFIDDIETSDTVPERSPPQQRIPQRTMDWIRIGGERANGPGWIQHSFFPPAGATETEIACRMNGTPIHRCALKALPDPRDVITATGWSGLT